MVKTLEKADRKWADELDSVLWNLRTTSNCSIGYKPFFMAYGVEVVLPREIARDAPRTREYKEKENKLGSRDDMDALDEAWGVTIARSAI